MTVVAAQTSATGTVPVAEGVALVHGLLDTVDAGALGQVTARDVAEVDRAMSRLAALKLSMVAAAHRQRAAEQAGMTDTRTWLAACTRSWGAKAAAEVALAVDLAESLTATRRALAAGSLSPEHAAVIATTARRLPDTLTAAERSTVETALVARARLVDPARLRRSARRALEAAQRSAEQVREHEDTELRDEEARARRRARLTLHDNLDGTVSGHFTVPTLAGAILRKAIQQMVSPRRRREGGPDAGRSRDALNGDGPTAGPSPEGRNEDGSNPGRGRGGGQGREGRDWAHEFGTAFVELLEHLPTDHLSGKVAATVVVTIDHDRLRESLGAAHLDTGHDLSAGEARRLACSSGVLPAVLGGGSLPLDLGRSRRFYSEPQRVALATTYDECAAEGCDRPYAWTELHHEDPWEHGGRTDLERAVPVCGADHRRMHDPRYEHRVLTDAAGRKTVSFHRRT